MMKAEKLLLLFLLLSGLILHADQKDQDIKKQLQVEQQALCKEFEGFLNLIIKSEDSRELEIVKSRKLLRYAYEQECNPNFRGIEHHINYLEDYIYFVKNYSQDEGKEMSQIDLQAFLRAYKIVGSYHLNRSNT